MRGKMNLLKQGQSRKYHLTASDANAFLKASGSAALMKVCKKLAAKVLRENGISHSGKETDKAAKALYHNRITDYEPIAENMVCENLVSAIKAKKAENEKKGKHHRKKKSKRTRLLTVKEINRIRKALCSDTAIHYKPKMEIMFCKGLIQNANEDTRAKLSQKEMDGIVSPLQKKQAVPVPRLAKIAAKVESAKDAADTTAMLGGFAAFILALAYSFSERVKETAENAWNLFAALPPAIKVAAVGITLAWLVGTEEFLRRRITWRTMKLVREIERIIMENAPKKQEGN